MTERFVVNFPNKNIQDRLNPEAISSRDDQNSQASFEDELSVAADLSNKQERDFLKQQEKNKFSIIATTEYIQKMFSGQIRNNEIILIQDKRGYSAGNADTAPEQKNDNQEKIPASLVQAAHHANQKAFAEGSPRFAHLFMNAIKDMNLTSPQLLSEFAVPKIGIAEMIEELVQKVQFLKEGEVSHLKLDLKPERLGRLQIILSLQDDKLVLHVFASEEAKKILDTKIEQLLKALIDQGFTIDHFEVEIADQHDQPGGFPAEEFGLNDGKNSAFPDYDMLKIVQQADIINSIDRWLGDVMVNYVV